MTAFTRMPSPTWPAVIARVMAATSPLIAEYSARFGTPTTATTEHVLTIAACADLRRCGSAARLTRARRRC